MKMMMNALGLAALAVSATTTVSASDFSCYEHFLGDALDSRTIQIKEAFIENFDDVGIEFAVSVVRQVAKGKRLIIVMFSI